MTSELTLAVMRHAQAAGPDLGGSDFERALTPQGRVDAQRMGRWLNAHMPELNRVISSTALRTRQTVDAVLADWPVPAPDVLWEPSLYLADLDALVGILSGIAPGSVLLVGHNPGLEHLIQWLASAEHGKTRNFELSPAAIYVMRYRFDDGGVAEGSARVLSQMSPQ
jgi:phosphohistidine phosphatase